MNTPLVEKSSDITAINITPVKEDETKIEGGMCRVASENAVWMSGRVGL